MKEEGKKRSDFLIFVVCQYKISFTLYCALGLIIIYCKNNKNCKNSIYFIKVKSVTKQNFNYIFIDALANKTSETPDVIKHVWQRPGEMPHHHDFSSFSMTVKIVM